MVASDSYISDKAKSNIAILIIQFFFTLIDSKSDKITLFGTFLSLREAPDKSTLLESGN